MLECLTNCDSLIMVKQIFKYLNDFVADDAVDVLVCDDHLVVHQPDVPIHVAEVSEHLKAVRTLVFRHLKFYHISFRQNLRKRLNYNHFIFFGTKVNFDQLF